MTPLRVRARGCIASAAVSAAVLAGIPAHANAASNFGSLTQLSGPFGCANDDAAEGCGFGGALAGAASVAVSPDDRHVYVAANNSGTVTSFRRRRSGVLVPGSCIGNAPFQGCADGRGMSGAF